MTERTRVSFGMLIVVACGVSACGSESTADPSTTVGATTSIVPATVAATTPTASGWIALQQDAAGEKIFLIRADGSDLHSPMIGLRGGHQTNPDWSPTGDRLVFVLGTDLWTVGVDGSGAELLLECGATCIALDDPAWSPDGESILYSRLAEVGGAFVGTLEAVQLDDRHVDVLLTAPARSGYGGQRWSPDGRSLVVEVVHQSGSELDSEIEGVTLSVIDLSVDPLVPRPLTDPSLHAGTADWTPDGSALVYAALASPDAPAADLFRINVDGTGLTRLTHLADAGGEAVHPDVLPDGRVLMAAVLEAGGAYVLAVVGDDGGDPVPAFGTDLVEAAHPRAQPLG